MSRANYDTLFGLLVKRRRKGSVSIEHVVPEPFASGRQIARLRETRDTLDCWVERRVNGVEQITATDYANEG